MGRQPKIGLDFWLRDVRLFQDPKLRRPRQKFGILAPFVYECLLDILYSDRGYYIEYAGEAREDVLWQIEECFRGAELPEDTTLGQIIDELVAVGLFDETLYKKGILTSKRAQKNYFVATMKRKTVGIDFSIWLLSREEMLEFNPNGTSQIIKSYDSWVTSQANIHEMEIYDVINPQSRVEESRGEQTREEKNRENGLSPDRYERDSTDDASETKQHFVIDWTRQAPSGKSELGTVLEMLKNQLGCALDETFQKEVCALLAQGLDTGQLWQAVALTNQKNPKNKIGYLRTILKKQEKLLDTGPAHPANPLRPLDAWEKDWLVEWKARKTNRNRREIS